MPVKKTSCTLFSFLHLCGVARHWEEQCASLEDSTALQYCHMPTPHVKECLSVPYQICLKFKIGGGVWGRGWEDGLGGVGSFSIKKKILQISLVYFIGVFKKISDFRKKQIYLQNVWKCNCLAMCYEIISWTIQSNSCCTGILSRDHKIASTYALCLLSSWLFYVFSSYMILHFMDLRLNICLVIIALSSPT